MEIIVARYSRDAEVKQKVGVQVYLVFDESTLPFAGPAIGMIHIFGERVEKILAEVETESARIGIVTP